LVLLKACQSHRVGAQLAFCEQYCVTPGGHGGRAASVG
jgi:hypothetical protein